MDKTSLFFSLLMGLSMLIWSTGTVQEEFSGPYLGQQPPGTTPAVFAPGIVSTPDALEIGCAWSPDGLEFYFVRQDANGGRMMVTRRDDRGWSEPAPLMGIPDGSGFEPCVSPDNSLFLYTRMKPPESGNEPVSQIWCMDKAGSSLSRPRLLGPGMFCSMAGNGSLYLTRNGGDKPGIIKCGKPLETWGTFEYQDGGVNAPAMGAHPCIDPEERFIVFDSRRGENPDNADLYVCFRLENGNWGPAYSLGDKINTPWNDLCPALSPDGKYLFYMSKGDIYWVSIVAINELKPVVVFQKKRQDMGLKMT